MVPARVLIGIFEEETVLVLMSFGDNPAIWKGLLKFVERKSLFGYLCSGLVGSNVMDADPDGRLGQTRHQCYQPYLAFVDWSPTVWLERPAVRSHRGVNKYKFDQASVKDVIMIPEDGRVSISSPEALKHCLAISSLVWPV
jgi:hypothetical protein